jgi:hypothetical protein
MSKYLRLASMSALLVTTGFFATGCECQDSGTDAEGRSVTTCESLQKFVGTKTTETVAYTDGAALNFNGVKGQVDVRIGSGSDVQVEFTPFSWRGFSKEAEATDDIEKDLQTSVNSDGSINVTVSRTSGASSELGADVLITLPAAFNGAVNMNIGSGFVDVDLGSATPTAVTITNDGAGDIAVAGARGPLNIKGSFDIDVGVAEWGPTGANGSILSDGLLGNVTVSLPTLSAGSIQAQADQDGIVTGPSPIPSNWEEAVSAPYSKTYSFGLEVAGEPGALVTVQAGENITIEAR